VVHRKWIEKEVLIPHPPSPLPPLLLLLLLLLLLPFLSLFLLPHQVPARSDKIPASYVIM